MHRKNFLLISETKKRIFIEVRRNLSLHSKNSQSEEYSSNYGAIYLRVGGINNVAINKKRAGLYSGAH